MNGVALHKKLATYLESDADFKSVYSYTRARFNAAKNLTAHNWEHIYRDIINAIIIGELEGAEMSIVLPAMAMHDIGFLYGGTGKTHAAIGADNLDRFLKEGNLKLHLDKKARITDCIRTHKGDMHGAKPDSFEAKVVSDADLLEKFGPIGVYQGGIRTFTEFNLDSAEIVKRLSQYPNLVFQTASATKLAAPMRAFSAEFAAALAKALAPYQEAQL